MEHSTGGKVMQTRDYRDAINSIPEDERMRMLVVSILVTRIASLPKLDQEDLFALIRELPKVETPEDRNSIQRAMEEILAQSPVATRPLPEATSSERLKHWSAHVGRRIKELREKAGLTQIELAGKAGIPQSHLSRLENAEYSPTNKTLTKIAEALGVQVGEIDPCAD